MALNRPIISELDIDDRLAIQLFQLNAPKKLMIMNLCSGIRMKFLLRKQNIISLMIFPVIIFLC